MLDKTETLPHNPRGIMNQPKNKCYLKDAEKFRLWSLIQSDKDDLMSRKYSREEYVARCKESLGFDVVLQNITSFCRNNNFDLKWKRGAVGRPRGNVSGLKNVGTLAARLDKIEADRVVCVDNMLAADAAYRSLTQRVESLEARLNKLYAPLGAD